jgi:putative oxidoreductase
MNWSGAQTGEGFEFHILAIAIAAAVTIKGSGLLSIDRLLGRSTAAPVGSRRSSDLATGH